MMFLPNLPKLYVPENPVVGCRPVEMSLDYFSNHCVFPIIFSVPKTPKGSQTKKD